MGYQPKAAEQIRENRSTIARLLVMLLLCVQPSATVAEWRVLVEEDQTGELTQRRAIVDSRGGERLAIYKDDQQRVHGIFILRQGLESLVSKQCPTFRVDKRRPLVLSGVEEQSCEGSASEVKFYLGSVQEGRIASPVLLQLMNGNTAWLRYRLKHVGYAEAAFDLQRSKQALADIIGPDVAVEWR